MKLIFFLLILSEKGMNSTAELRVLYYSQEVILKYLFHPYHNSYEKACCKFDQSRCFLFVNNRGQVDPLYRARIFITNYDGQFEVKMRNLSIMDAGTYRCGVKVFPVTYQDVQVTVFGLTRYSGVNTVPLSPKSSIKPAVHSSSPSTPSVSEDGQDKLSWRISYMLAAVLSVLVLAVISMTLLVCRLKTRKKKSTDKSGICGSPNVVLEQNGTIYSVVEFKPHQDPFQLYANLKLYNPKDIDASSNRTVTVEESVEYSTIMRAPA